MAKIVAPKVNVNVNQRERFSRAGDLFGFVITDDCPVAVERGAYLRDNTFGKISLQLKFVNCGMGKIASVFVEGALANAAGAEVANTAFTAAYDDIDCDEGENFGTKKLIMVPAVQKYVFIKHVSVVWANGKTRDYQNPDVTRLLQVRPFSVPNTYLNYVDNAYEVCVVPYRYNPNAYVCSCGTLATNSQICPHCRKTFVQVQQESTLEGLQQISFGMRKSSVARPAQQTAAACPAAPHPAAQPMQQPVQMAQPMQSTQPLQPTEEELAAARARIAEERARAEARAAQEKARREEQMRQAAAAVKALPDALNDLCHGHAAQVITAVLLAGIVIATYFVPVYYEDVVLPHRFVAAATGFAALALGPAWGVVVAVAGAVASKFALFDKEIGDIFYQAPGLLLNVVYALVIGTVAQLRGKTARKCPTPWKKRPYVLAVITGVVVTVVDDLLYFNLAGLLAAAYNGAVYHTQNYFVWNFNWLVRYPFRDQEIMSLHVALVVGVTLGMVAAVFLIYALFARMPVPAKGQEYAPKRKKAAPKPAAPQAQPTQPEQPAEVIDEDAQLDDLID